MKRTTLRRKKPMKRWRPKAERRNSYARRERFCDYMLSVKQLGCAAWNLDGHRCEGVIEADHAGARGMGRKCSDFETIPLCKAAHDARPGRRPPFASMDRERMREWIAEAIRQTQEAVLCQLLPGWRDLVDWQNSFTKLDKDT